tara:strand:- start:43 stop:507 length:465 start_codon:yes stop_codon:yes gene_type:complete
MTDQEVLNGTIKRLVRLAQIRNAVSEIVNSEEWAYTFIDNMVNVADFTHYAISDRYFLNFYTAEELDYFIQKPWKYYNNINLCKLYDLVLEMAFGSPLERFEVSSRKWDIHYEFENFADKNIYPEEIVEYIDNEIADELLDEIDYYTDKIANTN